MLQHPQDEKKEIFLVDTLYIGGVIMLASGDLNVLVADHAVANGTDNEMATGEVLGQECVGQKTCT